MSSTPQNGDSPSGYAYAIGAYVIWGFLPLFMKALSHVPPVEVIAQRVLWSLPIALAVLLWQGRAGDVVAALRNPRMLAMAALTAVLISINWLTYVWAVGNGHALDAALGYYINPLFSILLGAALLGERLSRSQLFAIALAAAAVVLLTVQAGNVPIVALVLTVSWGFYAYCKKSLPLGPNQGFTLEVLLLTPLALAFVVWQIATGQSRFVAGTWTDIALLISCGPATAVPLLLYANGAKRLRLSTIGILQYISPTMIFMCAVLFLGEEFSAARMIAFPMIWAALVIYSVSLVRQGAARRREAALTRRMQ